MDRPLSPEIIQQSKRKTWLKGLSALLVLGTAAYATSYYIAPSVQAKDMLTATVESGPVESIVSATGTVLPEIEQVLSSPIESRVLKILHKAGDSLSAGEPILMLDLETTVQAHQRLTDQIALKANALSQLEHSTESQLAKLRSQAKVRDLQLGFKKLQLDQDRQLLAGSAVARNDYEQSRIAAEVAQAEYEELVATQQHLRQTTELQKQGLLLELKMLRAEQQGLARQIELASTKADRKGILTWVTLTEGATIRKGDILAKLADLSSYRVEASVSDIHAARVATGLPVRVRIDNARKPVELTGTISQVLPTIENGAFRIQIRLDSAAHPALRPNLRVNTLLIAGQKARTLRLKRPVFIGNSGREEVFVLSADGQYARRVAVRTGLKGDQYVEITEGLQAGERVIINNMKQYEHVSELRIKP